MQSPRFIVYRIKIHSCNSVHWNVNEKSEEKKGSHNFFLFLFKEIR